MAKKETKTGLPQTAGQQSAPAGALTAGAPEVVSNATVPSGWSLDITEPPFVVGQAFVKRLTVVSVSFVQFVAMVKAAELARARDGGDNNRKYYFRERIKATLRAWDASGNPVALSENDILMLPARYAAEVSKADETIIEPQGEILLDGDGIGKPVLYKLGTPLRTGTDGMSITELEFQARTLGDIEEVLTNESQSEQTLALVKGCAKPVGGPVQLQALPSWAIDGLSLTDGLIILNKVLPRFLL